MQGSIKIIDFEHHYYLPELLDWLKKRTDYPYYNDKEGLMYKENANLPLPLHGFNSEHIVYDEVTDVDELRLSIMDKAGVDVAAISSGGMIEELPREEAVYFARKTNDAVAEAVKRHPDRFIGTICLPTTHVEDAIKELDRAVNELGLRYWHTHSNYGEHYLFEPQFEPILARCAELNIPFYLHPHNPSTEFLRDHGPALSSAGFGFGVDTMKTSILLIIGGLFDRYPNLRMILGHMAEYYPYCLDRMDNRFGVYGKSKMDPYVKCEGSFTDYFKNKNVLMTTSGIYDPNVALCAINTIGIDNITFGTDYPYEDFKAEVDFIKDLPLSISDKEKIFHANGEKYILGC